MPGANAKALDAASKLMKSRASALFSVDEEAGKVLCLVSVGKEGVAQGLSAKDWIAEITTLIGGKGGGKDTNAQAVGDRPEKIADALEIARGFAQMKLKS